MDEMGAVDIRLRLEGEVKQRFLEIKQAKGVKNNTEVLRLIINDYYRQMEKPGV